MKTKSILLKAFLPVFCALMMCSCSDSPYVSIRGYAQGGTYMVTLRLPDGGPSAESLKESIDSILNVIDTTFSGYNKSSMLTRFNDGARVTPNDEFIDLYNRSYSFFEATGHTLDVSCGPLFDIWGFGFKEGKMPSGALVDSVAACCGMASLVKDMHSVLAPDGSLVSQALIDDDSLFSPKLNFNAVAQGYSCDLVASFLKHAGCTDMLIDVGGEIFCCGLNPEGKGWTLGVDKPTDGNNERGAALQTVFSLDGSACGVVTSGNYRKFYVVDGRKYSHTIDPRTARPVEHNLLSATVIAPDATTADAFATACMVMGLEEAKSFIESGDGLEAFLVYDEGGRFRTWASKGFPESR